MAILVSLILENKQNLSESLIYLVMCSLLSIFENPEDFFY